MKINTATAAFAIMLLSIPSPAAAMMLADDAPATSDEQDSNNDTKSKKLDEIKKALDSLSDKLNAERDKPTDSVKEGGGEIEASLLSAFAFKAAAKQIARNLDGEASATYLVMAASDQVSTDNWLIFDSVVAGLCAELMQDMTCGRNKGKFEINRAGKDKQGQRFEVQQILPAVGSLVSLVSSLFRSETEISKLPEGLTNEGLLAIALNQDKPEKFKYLTLPRLRKGIINTNTYRSLDRLLTVRNAFVKANMDKAGKIDDTAAGLVKKVDDFIALVMTKDSSGKTPLIDIIKAEVLFSHMNPGTVNDQNIAAFEILKDRNVDGDNVAKKQPEQKDQPKIMLVKIEKSGGTMLKRKGIDVILGAPSIRVSSGLIVSYVIENADGTAEKSGFISCATKLTALKNVHKLQADKFTPNCL
jgi:hypothetical protein